MINAIQLLKMEAQARRSMTTPNARTITECTSLGSDLYVEHAA